MAQSPATAVLRTERECLRAAGLIALGAAAAVVLLWAGSFPGWPMTAGITLSALVLGSVLLVAGAEPPWAARWLPPAGVAAALALAIGGGVVIESSTQAALVARFEHSRAAFDAAVAAADPVPSAVADHWLPYPGQCPDRLGSYEIADCHAFTGGYVYLQARGTLSDEAGFAYAPHGIAATEEGSAGLPADNFTHLTGPWYAWTCDC